MQHGLSAQDYHMSRSVMSHALMGATFAAWDMRSSAFSNRSFRWSWSVSGSCHQRGRYINGINV